MRSQLQIRPLNSRYLYIGERIIFKNNDHIYVVHATEWDEIGLYDLETKKYYNYSHKEMDEKEWEIVS